MSFQEKWRNFWKVKEQQTANAVPNTDLSALETPEERKLRIRGLWICHVVTFVFSLSFSIVFTGVFPYLQQILPGESEETVLNKYSWVVALNPIGQVIFSPILGWLSDKLNGVRWIGIGTSVVFIIANILYAILSVFPTNDGRYAALLISRFLTGATSGNIAPFRAYIAKATFSQERTMHLSILAAFQGLGMTVGPAIQAMLTPLQCSPNDAEDFPYFSFDMFSSAGWVSAITGVVSLVIMWPGIFFEFSVAQKEQQYLAKKAAESQPDKKPQATLKPDLFAAWTCIIMFFMYFWNFVVMETVGTPICQDHFGWTADEIVSKFGIIMSVNGGLAFLCFFIIAPLARRFDERVLLISLGVVTAIVGRAAFFPFPGVDNPAVCVGVKNNCTIELDKVWGGQAILTDDLPKCKLKEETKFSNPYEHQNHGKFKNFRSYAPLGEVVDTVECDVDEPCDCLWEGKPMQGIEQECVGCHLDWCAEQPALDLVQFIIGVVILTLGHPFRIALTQSIYTKMLGPIPQGTWMGLLSASGSLARVSGPLFVGWIYREYGTYWTMGLPLLGLVIGLVLMLFAYKRLIPYMLRVRQQNGGGMAGDNDNL